MHPKPNRMSSHAGFDVGQCIHILIFGLDLVYIKGCPPSKNWLQRRTHAVSTIKHAMFAELANDRDARACSPALFASQSVSITSHGIVRDCLDTPSAVVSHS